MPAENGGLFSLVVATYNEAGNVVDVLERVEAALAGVPHEILIVDDDSPDKTWEIAERHAASHPAVRVLRRRDRRGLSSAIVDGFRAARGRWLGVIDADLSHDPALLPAMLEQARQGAEIVVGSRRVPGGGMVDWPLARRFYSKAATVVTRWWLGTPVHDPVSGYFILRRDAFERVQEHLNPKGYKLLIELLARVQPEDVRELPFVFRDRRAGQSKLSPLVAFQFFSMLWDLRAYTPLVKGLRRAYHQGRHRKIIAWLQPGSVLDIGCGRPCETMPDMAFLRLLARPGAQGLDIRPVEGPYPVTVGSILKIPFPDATFDNVVAMEVLEHVDDMELALREVRRVLKPGGVFLASTPDCNVAWNAIWDVWTHFVSEMWLHAHLVHLRLPDWKRLLEKHFDGVEARRHWRFDLLFRGRKPS